MLPVKIKLIHPNAKMPEYKTKGSSGADLYAVEDVMIPGKEVRTIPTGIQLEIPPGFEAQIRPRSSISKQFPFDMPNSPGTVDSDYRGEVQVLIRNLAEDHIWVYAGQRIAQMIICPILQVKFTETKELSKTDRGEGGFGSTGR